MREMFHFLIRQKFCIRMIAVCIDSKMYVRIIGIFIKIVINLVKIIDFGDTLNSYNVHFCGKKDVV